MQTDRTEALKKIYDEILKPFAKDFCAFVAINGFIAMLVVWYLATHPSTAMVN